MTRQPNKPDGDFKSNGETRDVKDEQAVKNQAVVSPEDYPDKVSVLSKSAPKGRNA